ncbi:hypothetical protein [Actinophytocola algeriensis]|uniref:Hpr(Ser) kinase/phosphatase n=1 Tax=Actinophytocola algeriensis TaxID=1768010 RepID=A0A7W7VDN9_9PSEU|nr:hypothetical protein [Actinophytocola algeriensis]MBB4906284.1 hypothetical protein [Actinophytocola algeriensis]MBE1477765.1 hypothetical protein [Actinophytocola algeriensis]
MNYHAYGLHIASDIPLPLPPGGGVPTLVLRRGEDREVPHERPQGERLAEVSRPDRTIFYTLARGPRTILRYPGLCDFEGDPKLEHVTVHLHPGADEGLLPVLISGAVLAVHLMLHHALVLHASAVDIGGSAVAFVGSSGMGKSTLAAALCGLGCSLVSDDLLRVDGGMVHPGATENRLRENARELASGDTYETADGRLALRPTALVDAPLPLAACVVPRPSRDVTEVALRRLGTAEALLRLSRYPRVLGWSDAASMATTFQGLGDLVERVPVFEAAIPWGPPFADGVLADLLAALQPLDQSA